MILPSFFPPEIFCFHNHLARYLGNKLGCFSSFSNCFVLPTAALSARVNTLSFFMEEKEQRWGAETGPFVGFVVPSWKLPLGGKIFPREWEEGLPESEGVNESNRYGTESRDECFPVLRGTWWTAVLKRHRVSQNLHLVRYLPSPETPIWFS